MWIFLPILGAILGYCVGRVYFSALAEGRFVRWKHLMSSPEKVDAILAASTDVIFVHTSAGIFANYHVKDCISYALANCWESVSGVDEGFGAECEYDAPSSFKVSSPPRKYAERWAVQHRGAEWNNETHYIRTASGDIWVWQWGNFSLGMIGPYFMISCVGVILGSVCGLFLAWLINNKLG
jgi:hypothetical protein